MVGATDVIRKALVREASRSGPKEGGTMTEVDTGVTL